jgi:xanthosine utilization system XapX-like protein
MAFKNYQKLFKEIQKSYFLYLQSLVLFLTTYIDWTLIPYVTKLEGTYLPVFMISFFMLLGALDGIVQPLFKHIKIYNIYLCTICLDIVQILSYGLLEYSIVGFTYLILSIFTLQAITFEIARVHTVDFMQDESIELKDYLMLRSFVISIAIITGSLSAMLFDYFEIKLINLLIYAAILGLGAIYIQYKLYKKFKKIIYGSSVEISKEKRNIFEKFRD